MSGGNQPIAKSSRRPLVAVRPFQTVPVDDRKVSKAVTTHGALATGPADTSAAGERRRIRGHANRGLYRR